MRRAQSLLPIPRHCNNGLHHLQRLPTEGLHLGGGIPLAFGQPRLEGLNASIEAVQLRLLGDERFL